MKLLELLKEYGGHAVTGLVVLGGLAYLTAVSNAKNDIQFQAIHDRLDKIEATQEETKSHAEIIMETLAGLEKAVSLALRKNYKKALEYFEEKLYSGGVVETAPKKVKAPCTGLTGKKYKQCSEAFYSDK